MAIPLFLSSTTLITLSLFDVQTHKENAPAFFDNYELMLMLLIFVFSLLSLTVVIIRYYKKNRLIDLAFYLIFGLMTVYYSVAFYPLLIEFFQLH
jgi:hypothetical protein